MNRLLLVSLLLPALCFAQGELRNGELRNGNYGGETPAPSGDGSNGDTKVITSYSGGSDESDLNWWLGFKFQVGASDITVTTLGRAVYTGNSGTHTIKIFNETGTEITSASVNLSGATVGQYKYASCTPATLTAAAIYFCLSLESSGGDNWKNSADVTPTAAITVLDAGYSTDGVTMSTPGVGANKSHGPTTFQYH